MFWWNMRLDFSAFLNRMGGLIYLLFMTTQQDQNPSIQEEGENTNPIDLEKETPEDDVSVSKPESNLADDIIRLQASLVRSQADYQNLLMRVERDKSDMIRFISAKILLPLLTQVDNLERAIAIKADVVGDAFVDGVRSLHAGLVKYLETQ